MKIISAYIKNFKNIIEETITDFKDVNLIIGDNGNGKSGFAEALVYLLTNHLNDKREEYIRWYQDEFILRLKFIHFSKTYDYEIIGNKSGANRTLKIEGDKTEYKNSDATKKMAEIIDPILTRYSSISEQGNATKLLFEKDTERLEKFKRLLGIEKLKEKDKLQKEDIDNNKQEIKTLEAEIGVLENRTFEFEKVPDLPNIDNALQQLEDLQKEKEVYDKEQSDYKVYEEKLNQYKNAEKEIENLNGQMQQIELEVGNLSVKELPEFDKEYLITISEQLIELEKESVELEKDIALYNQNKKQFDELEKDIIEKEEELKNVGRIKRIRKPEISEEELPGLESYVNSIYNKARDLQNMIKAVENGECPTCKTDWSGGKLDKEKEQLEVESKLYSEQSEKYKKAKEDIQVYKDTLNENKIIQNNIDTIKGQLESLIVKRDNFTSIKKPEKDISVIEDLIEQFSLELAEIKKVEKEYLNIEKENNEIEKKISEKSTQLKIIESKVEEYKKVKEPKEFNFTNNFNEEEFSQVQEKINQYNITKKEVERIEQFNDKLKKEKKEVQLSVEEKYGRIDTLRKLNRTIELARKNLNKDFSAWLISKGTQKIQNEMNKFFQESYSGRYQISIKQNKTSVNFYYGNEDHMVSVNMASGFEKALLATAFRKALCSLQPLGIFILDESDSDSGDENSMKLFKTLIEEGNQYFIITHKNETKQMLINEYKTQVYEFRGGEII